MLNTLLHHMAQRPTHESQWGQEVPRLIQSIDAHTENLRSGKAISDEAAKGFDQAKQAYGPKGIVSLSLYFPTTDFVIWIYSLHCSSRHVHKTVHLPMKFTSAFSSGPETTLRLSFRLSRRTVPRSVKS